MSSMFDTCGPNKYYGQDSTVFLQPSCTCTKPSDLVLLRYDHGDVSPFSGKELHVFAKDLVVMFD